MRRLDEATVAEANAVVPRYDRESVRAGVVHLGLGAFARAHLASYLDDLLTRGERGLGILGVSLRHDDVPLALGPQDGLYTLGEVDGVAVAHRVIGAVLGVVHAPSQPDLVRSALASPDTRFVSITVTEKGYCWEPASRRLDVEHPDVLHDLAHPDDPSGLLGHLLLMARDRRDAGSGGVTVLSLDNLPANGTTLRDVMLDMAAASDPTLVGWIEQHLRFPCSMVDRMVPATSDEFREATSAAIGVVDAWPVRCEPYRQWVVERDWIGEMPPLAEVGVQVVDDVARWETMKLRVLNGLHTSAAHYGLVHGLETVDAVTADPGGRALLDRVGAEILEVLDPPTGEDAHEYLTTTLRRFANAGLGHRCSQIATDTSQKLPQRLLDTIRLRLDDGLPIDALAEVLALWTRTAGTIDDPLADRCRAVAERHAGDPATRIAALLSIDEIFGDLGGDERLVAAVQDAAGAA